MGLLQDTPSCGLCMRWECRERFRRHQLWTIRLFCYADMHHGPCVTHVSWCLSGSLTRGGGENVPVIPSASATRNLPIWQKAHADWNKQGHVLVQRPDAVTSLLVNRPLTRYVKLRFAHAPVMPGTLPPPLTYTCVTHVTWYMSWSPTP